MGQRSVHEQWLFSFVFLVVVSDWVGFFSSIVFVLFLFFFVLHGGFFPPLHCTRLASSYAYLILSAASSLIV
jgi:hypothetical protein